MIIYEGTCEDFINQSLDREFRIGEEISKKMNIFHHQCTHTELESWNNSLPALARVLNLSEVPGKADIGIEYNIKGDKLRIDAMICGKDSSNTESAVIVELKQWSSVDFTEKQYFVHTYGGAGEDDYWHPSYQAANYANIIQNFYEYVQETPVLFHSCSYLHNMNKNNYGIIGNKELYPLIVNSPVFLKGDEHDMARYLENLIVDPSTELLKRID